MFYRSKLDPRAVLLQKAQALLKSIESYTSQINAEAPGDDAPWYRTQRTHDLKKKKYQGADSHLIPASTALIQAIERSCYPVIDKPACTTQLKIIEQHLGAIASRSDYTLGATSRFNSRYHELLTLVEQFRILTDIKPTEISPLDHKDTESVRSCFSTSPEPHLKAKHEKIIHWQRDHYEPLKKKLESALRRDHRPSDRTYHGVNNYLYEVLRLTTDAINAASPEASQSTMANECLQSAEEMLGTVASWTPYFRAGCGTFNFEFNSYYQSTCKLLETAKTIITNASDDPTVMSTIVAQSPRTIRKTPSGRSNRFNKSQRSFWNLLPQQQETELGERSKRNSDVPISAATLSALSWSPSGRRLLTATPPSFDTREGRVAAVFSRGSASSPNLTVRSSP